MSDLFLNGGNGDFIKQSMDNMGTGQNDHSQNDHHTLVNMGMDNMTRLTRKEATMGNRGSGSQNDYGQNDQHLKDISKDSFKDSLSIDEVIFLFYNSIGQEKLSKAKRERAKNCFEELIQDGFTNDDIQFAVEWTIKNAKEKPYDFALIKDTIGQAIAAKKETEAEEQKNLKREQNRAKQLAEEKKLEEEREKIEAYKESLSPKQRSELREKALSEIKKLGTIREELIGQPLIEAKENEILKDELSADE